MIMDVQSPNHVHNHESFILFGHFLFIGLFRLLSIRDLEPNPIMLIKSITLNRTHRNSRMKNILKIDKTQKIIPTSISTLLDQPDALKPRKRAEDI